VTSHVEANDGGGTTVGTGRSVVIGGLVVARLERMSLSSTLCIDGVAMILVGEIVLDVAEICRIPGAVV
jgi:hypothetical protein